MVLGPCTPARRFSLSGFVTDREAAINLCQQRWEKHNKAIRVQRKAEMD
jgi:hypothetical protein